MGLNDKITERFTVETSLSRQEIFDSLAYHKRQFSGFGSGLLGHIDFKEIRIKTDKLEIVRSPGMFTPFRAYGKITIDIVDNGHKTILNCAVIPYNENYPIIIGLFIGALSIWTLIAFAFGLRLNALIVVLTGWLGMGLVMYVKYLYTRHLLLDYSKRTINELIQYKQASR